MTRWPELRARKPGRNAEQRLMTPSTGRERSGQAARCFGYRKYSKASKRRTHCGTRGQQGAHRLCQSCAWRPSCHWRRPTRRSAPGPRWPLGCPPTPKTRRERKVEGRQTALFSNASATRPTRARQGGESTTHLLEGRPLDPLGQRHDRARVGDVQLQLKQLGARQSEAQPRSERRQPVRSTRAQHDAGTRLRQADGRRLPNTCSITIMRCRGAAASATGGAKPRRAPSAPNSCVPAVHSLCAVFHPCPRAPTALDTVRGELCRNTYHSRRQ